MRGQDPGRARGALVAATALVALACACASGADKSRITGDAQRYFRLGEVQFGQGKTLQAIESLKKAIEMDPKMAEAENLLGLIYLSNSQYQDAQGHLKQAARINPYFTDARNNLGVVYKEMKQYDRALKEFQGVLNDKTYATPEKVYANMGHVYLEQGNTQEAIRSFRQAIAIKPDYLLGILGLAMSYQKAGQRDLARNELQRVVRLGPDSAEAARAQQLLDGQGKREGP